MRLLSRLAIVFAAVVIFSVSLTGCGPATTGPYTLEEAAKRASTPGKERDALLLYGQIVRENQRKDPNVAAKALYEGGLAATDPARFAKTEDLRNEGEDMAAQMWRQLRDEFPEQARQHLGPQSEKLTQLTDRIDLRNRKDWKYQIIDALVSLTGRSRAFSYGLALVILAFLVKTLLFPLTKRQYAAQREMMKMQPLVKALQSEYKGTELQQKQMELYKEHGVNPFAGCAPTLAQLPFLLLIFTSIRLYEHAFVHGHFLWIGSGLSAAMPHVFAPNLAMPDMPLLIGYALTNYITMRLVPTMDPQQQQQQNTMALMTTGIFFWMFLQYKWSSAFVLYWFVLNLISIWQQYKYIYKPHKMKLATEPAAPINVTATDPAKSNGRKGNGGTAAPVSAENGKKVGAQPTPPRARPRKKKK
jgi:YidC/Oxa1 family membrane protein insertase